MGNVETANTLALIGAILSIVLGTIYLVLGSVGLALHPLLIFWIFWGVPLIIGGILALIFGFLTLFLARKNLLEGDLKAGAIMCFIFGGITAPAIGGILTIVAAILSIIAWHEQRTAAKTLPIPLPPALPATPAVIYCAYCHTKLSPEDAFCSSCGKKVKKQTE